jgi:hypothetical protein
MTRTNFPVARGGRPEGRDLRAPIIGKGQDDALVERVFTLETLSNVRELRSVLQTA